MTSTCSSCGGPKPSGRGRRYCEPCRSSATEQRRRDSQARIREWEQMNPGREAKRRYNSSPKGREMIRAARQSRRQADPFKAWSTTLSERFGITAEQYNALLEEQGGCCALCERPASCQIRRLHVDHDHRCCPDVGRSCGRCIRGLLCGGCNRALGWYESRRLKIDQYVDQARSFA